MIGEVTEDQDDIVAETESFYEGDGFSVSFMLQDSRADGYNATVKVENTGNSVIENWRLGFDFRGEIANIWNAVLESSEDYDVVFKVKDSWNEGFNADITISNQEENTIEDWVLEFDFDAEITSIWNGTILSGEGGHYVIQNAGYNANVLANERVSFGIQGKFAGEACEPTNYVLRSYSGQEEKQEEQQDDRDIRIVMNADSKLQIGYAYGNDRHSVTDNVILPAKLEGASITWISSKPEVISKTGAVCRSDETQLVTLKAVIQSNDYSKERDFELRVIKNTYENYDTDYIYDMDSLELLYIYNDDPDALEGRSSFGIIRGKVSDGVR